METPGRAHRSQGEPRQLLPDVLVVGASARAAAYSAVRGGLRVAAADLFADSDLTALCPAQALAAYPDGLPTWLQQWPGVPWMYTGALENRPDLLALMAQTHRLLGNPAERVRPVRDPWLLAHKLQARGLHFPTPTRALLRPPAGAWLIKSADSAGGRRVRRLPAEIAAAATPTLSRREYLQPWVAGRTVSGLFVAADGHSRLVGLCRQWTGASWAGGRDFWYCGSLSWAAPPPKVVQQFEAAGAVIAEEFQLVGLFGVDAVLDADRLWLLEVNPRYTASVEVVERAAEINCVSLHMDACRFGHLGAGIATLHRISGKAVLFARQSGQITAAFGAWAQQCNQGHSWPIVADLPRVGAPLRAGWPIATLLGDGDSAAAVERGLKRLAKEAYRCLQARSASE